ncbi:MAG: hypothetical protein R3E83_17460 [Burkholderiaceae bacterium]
MPETASLEAIGAGRVCPLDYTPDWAQAWHYPGAELEVVYIVGGLYGNEFALRAIETMFESEPAGHRLMVFNGDYHWFDVADDAFAGIERAVGAHRPMRGNVETELAAMRGDEIGCGCAYPEQVAQHTVAWSNEIMSRLTATARAVLKPAQLDALGRLPATAIVALGNCRVGITHGDDRSLAGWALSEDRLEHSLIDGLTERMRLLDIDVLASSHTCLPVAQCSTDGHGDRRIVINNGSAGMANFAADARGLLTRIARCEHRAPVVPLYESHLGDGLVVQAIPVAFDAAGWQERFAWQWPPGSAAHASYFERICHGPGYRLEQAVRDGFRRLN